MPTYTLIPNRRDHARQVFRNNLKRIRTLQDMTQCDLAKITGWPRGKISKLERGTSIATVLDLFTLADALRVEPADFLRTP